jgi:hypothetical protein
MNYKALEPILKTKKIRIILQSKELARLGDFLVNYIYSAVRIGKYGLAASIHVWDKSLTKAMALANFRAYLGKKTKPDRVADAGEAFVAYAYLTKLMTLEDMISIIDENLSETNFNSKVREKEVCAIAFSKLFEKIFEFSSKDNRFEF